MAYNPLHISLVLRNSIAEGDEDAFATLYMTYAPGLKAYAWKFTRSTADAEEILQESFLTIWLKREQLPEIKELQAWIYKIVAMNCLQWLRKQTSELHKREQAEHLTPSANNFTPSENLHWKELEKVIHTAILQLTPLRQQIYRMNREQGLKPSAIADQLRMPVGTVKNNLSIAIKTIRDHLTTTGYPLISFILLTKIF